MTIALVQSNNAEFGSGSTPTLALPGASTVGNLIVVAVSSYEHGPTYTVADGTHTYSSDSGLRIVGPAGLTIQVFYAVVTAATTLTITTTPSTADYCGYAIAEFSGTATTSPRAPVGTPITDTAPPWTGGPLPSLAAAGNLIFAAFAPKYGVGSDVAAGSGYAFDAFQWSSANMPIFTVWKQSTTSGVEEPTATPATTGTRWGGVAAAFYAASAAAADATLAADGGSSASFEAGSAGTATVTAAAGSTADFAAAVTVTVSINLTAGSTATFTVSVPAGPTTDATAAARRHNWFRWRGC